MSQYTDPVVLHALLLHFALILVPLILLDLFFRGYALWRAGRNNQSGWFVALLVFNTIGILPLIYLLFFQRRVVEPVVIVSKTKSVSSTRSPRSHSHR